jgi:phage baseplate assembly protein gpV
MADNRSALHQGQATERNVKSASARVGFDDLAGTVSGFMQVLFPATGGWNFFYTPKEGDQVVVSRLPNGAEEGYILGKVYTAGKMPQGGAENIILLVSDNGKNVIRFDADKGTLDLVVDQDGRLKLKNLDIEVKELTGLTTKDLEIEAAKHTGLTTGDLDVESVKPIGFQGTETQLGTDVLQVFFDELIAALKTRNPVVNPPAPWPKGAPVPPVPPIINMFLNGVIADIVAAAVKAKASCAKVLK